MSIDPQIEPVSGTVDHFWWLHGGEAWAQWCERSGDDSRSLQA